MKCPATGKDMHSQSSAINAAIRYSRKRGTPLRTYKCPECSAFHLTKKPLRQYVDILREREVS